MDVLCGKHMVINAGISGKAKKTALNIPKNFNSKNDPGGI